MCSGKYVRKHFRKNNPKSFLKEEKYSFLEMMGAGRNTQNYLQKNGNKRLFLANGSNSDPSKTTKIIRQQSNTNKNKIRKDEKDWADFQPLKPNKTV